MHKQENSKMRRTKILIQCAMAAMALSAVVSASASATKNPKWALCEARTEGTGQWNNDTCTEPGGKKTHETRLLLTENETREITGEANGVQKFSAAGLTITCKKLKFKQGAVILGGEPGKDHETLVYEECEIEGKPGCKVKTVGGTNGTIDTLPMTSTLVYASKEAEEKENLTATLMLFKPTTGEVFFEIFLEGEECPAALREKALPVKGELLAENEKGNEHLITHELSFPATALKVYWLQVEGKATEKEIKKLLLLTSAATYSGKVKADLAGSQLGQAWWLG
jgi:hypothetical protein